MGHFVEGNIWTRAARIRFEVGEETVHGFSSQEVPASSGAGVANQLEMVGED